MPFHDDQCLIVVKPGRTHVTGHLLKDGVVEGPRFPAAFSDSDGGHSVLPELLFGRVPGLGDAIGEDHESVTPTDGAIVVGIDS